MKVLCKRDDKIDDIHLCAGEELIAYYSSSCTYDNQTYYTFDISEDECLIGYKLEYEGWY